MNSLIEQIIVNILTQEMALDPARIWIRSQNRKIPTDPGLFMVVGMIDTQVMGNVVSMASETVDMVTTQHQISEVQQREVIQIDMLSRNTDALKRRWEAVAAMQSFYAQQQQELNNFKIARIPQSFLNTSDAEGGSEINRYSISVPCIVWYRKDVLLDSPLGDYYDDFTTRVDDTETIGTDTPLIEFEITPSTPAPPYQG